MITFLWVLALMSSRLNAETKIEEFQGGPGFKFENRQIICQSENENEPPQDLTAKIDRLSFQSVDLEFVKDKNHVFHYCDNFDADPRSFGYETDGKVRFLADKQHVYLPMAKGFRKMKKEKFNFIFEYEKGIPSGYVAYVYEGIVYMKGSDKKTKFDPKTFKGLAKPAN